MQSIDTYEKVSFMRALIQGPPGSGKTTLACNFPKVYFIDLDVNLGGPMRYQRNHQLPLPVGYDRVDVDELGFPVPEELQWDRLDKLLKAAQTNPEIETIVIDSATKLADMLFRQTERKNSAVKDGRQIFMFFLNESKKLIALLTQMQKNLILLAHEKVEKDEMTGVTQYRLAWPGQLGDYMGAFFTNVWRTEVTSVGFPPKPEFNVRTFQDPQHYGLKNDLELPTLFKFNWKTVEEKMK